MCGVPRPGRRDTPGCPNTRTSRVRTRSTCFAQLLKIQSDDRKIPLMAGQLAGKTEQDLRNLAAYYASLPRKVGQAAGTDEHIAKAAAIYRGGILSKKVAACASCHSPSAAGNDFAGFPRIAGQPVAYTVSQLTAYREGDA